MTNPSGATSRYPTRNEEVWVLWSARGLTR